MTDRGDDITISRAKFEKLLDLAAEAIDLQNTEFSNYPDEAEIALMFEMHEMADKEMDECLQNAIKRARILNAKLRKDP